MKRIKAPKFKVRINKKFYTLNEYELRQLQNDVALSYTKVIVRDTNNKKATINKDGSLSDNLYGLNILTDLKFNLLKINHEQTNFNRQN